MVLRQTSLTLRQSSVSSVSSVVNHWSSLLRDMGTGHSDLRPRAADLPDVLCDTRRRDVDTHYTLHIGAAGPTGQRWAPAWSTKFQLRRGRHVYSFRLEGSNARFDIPLDVVVQ